MINYNFNKKIIYNLKKNKNCYFSDGKSRVYYKDIYKKYLSLENFLEKNNLYKKKILSVVYNQTGIHFWINFINSYLAKFTVMPLEKNSQIYKKIEQYFDTIIIFNGSDFHVHNNLNKKNNKIFNITEYISSTSGSTGSPKMILHKFESIIKNSIETSNKISFKKNKNFLIAIPSFYNSAVCHFFTCLNKEMNFYSMEEFMFPKNLYHNLMKFKINYFGGAPIQIDWIVGYNKKNKNVFLEKIISSGDFLKESTISLYLKKKYKFKLYNIYGITEVGGRVFINDIRISKSPFTLGKSLRHFSIIKKRISKKIFEIGIKSKFNFLGYYSDRLTQTNKQKNIYLTNDLAIMINKNFKLQGRKNEIFKSSGVKIFPEYIKNEILKLNGISNAFVFAKHFDLFGNAPVVAYESKKEIKETFFISELTKKLEKKQIPLQFKYYKTFPYLKNKKINKIKIKNEI